MDPPQPHSIVPDRLPDYRRGSQFAKYAKDQDALADCRQHLRQYLSNIFEPDAELHASNSAKQIPLGSMNLTRSKNSTEFFQVAGHQESNVASIPSSSTPTAYTFFHSRTNSGASTSSILSNYEPSTFSSQSTTTTWTSATSTSSRKLPTQRNTRASPIDRLEKRLIQRILTYALELPRIILLQCYASATSPIGWTNQHFGGLDVVDLQCILKHAIFMVSHRMRHAAFEVLLLEGRFVIDICPTKHAAAHYQNTHFDRWQGRVPDIIKSTLAGLQYLCIQVPVPIVEKTTVRGAKYRLLTGDDDTVDGRVLEMKKEHYRVMALRGELEALTDLVVDQSSSLSRGGMSRRNVTIASSRQPLRRLDIIFVKPSPRSLVLPEFSTFFLHGLAFLSSAQAHIIWSLKGARLSGQLSMRANGLAKLLIMLSYCETYER
ncbi:hypothetical protein EK21DRAFT_113388 [Setomelanomma holmii]|uniref:Uncharacterized protein n=1 Tax=Setomelanomma holmii TaxID=210430 RepID=A0A9P4H7D1_9PLEO|nr:hypothetical protein EK21DRAFT_113388 [Setomelanomma holmii]